MVDCGRLWSTVVDCGRLWSTVGRLMVVLWSSYGHPMVDCGRPMVDCGRPMVDCGCPMVDCGRPMVDCGRPMVDCGRPMVDCGIPPMEQQVNYINIRNQAQRIYYEYKFVNFPIWIQWVNETITFKM